MCGLFLCSLGRNSIGAAGAAAIGAGMVHLSQLRALEYVLCPAVCAGPWCVFARVRVAMACASAGIVVCAVRGRAALLATVSMTRMRRQLCEL